MIYPRSIRARLVTLYAVTLTLIFVCFGGYTYWGFKMYLIQALDATLIRRAHQIADTIVSKMSEMGEAYVSTEISARYAPELNERIIRISDEKGRAIYVSQNASTFQAPPSFPTDKLATEVKLSPREELSGGGKLRVVAISYRLANGSRYLVEVGAPEAGIFIALNGLLQTLMLGFPFFIGLTSIGVYVLLGRALRPVDEIVKSAERISLQNLSLRLPVPDTKDEVESLTLALNRMISRLNDAFQVTNRFAGDASHELRTPLTIMRGELESLLKEENLTDEQLSQIGSVLEEVGRLTEIVEGLLLVSRLEAGESVVGKDPVDFSELAETTVEQMSPLAEEKSITLTCETEPDVMVEASEIRLKQIVVNLLDNAIKYTPDNGRVLVKVAVDAEWAVLEVRDNGIGISATALPHIFERFYRSEQVEARKARGTGLGLSMVQSIAEVHSGKVEVESREGQGAVFRVRVPRLELRMARRMKALFPDLK